MKDLNNPISTTNVKIIVENFPRKKIGADGFTGEFSQTFMGEVALILTKPFTLLENIAGGILSNSFFEDSITLISNPEYHYKKRRLQNLST